MSAHLTPLEPVADPTAEGTRRPLRRALVSVYDKTGLAELATALHTAGVAIVSTGSTAKTIEAAGVPVTPVEEVTGVGVERVEVHDRDRARDPLGRGREPVTERARLAGRRPGPRRPPGRALGPARPGRGGRVLHACLHGRRRHGRKPTPREIVPV